MSLRRLGVETHRPFSAAPHRPQFPAGRPGGRAGQDLQQEGKIRHIGLSEIDVDQLKAAQQITEIVSVQNMYNLPSASAEQLLDYSRPARYRLHPVVPVGVRTVGRRRRPAAALAGNHGASPSQLALAWLLKRSPVMLPIPGTSKVRHLEENVAAAEITFTEEEFETLAAAGAQQTV